MTNWLLIRLFSAVTPILLFTFASIEWLAQYFLITQFLYIISTVNISGLTSEFIRYTEKKNCNSTTFFFEKFFETDTFFLSVINCFLYKWLW